MRPTRSSLWQSYPERGSKVEYSAATVLPGGQVATTVVACQRWGMSTRYVGILGDDAAAALHREAFSRAGVEAADHHRSGGTSPQSLILVDGGGERTVLCRRDPRVALKPPISIAQWIVNARALHVDGYDTAAATVAAGWARAAGIPVIADLDELYPGVEELLENVDYLIVSRDIPCRLMEEPDLEMALRQMQRRYGCRLAAATLGDNGVLAWNGKQLHHVCCLFCSRGRYHRRRRYLPRRLHLRTPAELAPGTPTRLRLRRGRIELHRGRSQGRHSVGRGHRGTHGHGRSAPACPLRSRFRI